MNFDQDVLGETVLHGIYDLAYNVCYVYVGQLAGRPNQTGRSKRAYDLAMQPPKTSQIMPSTRPLKKEANRRFQVDE